MFATSKEHLSNHAEHNVTVVTVDDVLQKHEKVKRLNGHKATECDNIPSELHKQAAIVLCRPLKAK